MSSRWLGYGSLLVALILLFAVNIFGAGILPGTRVDLTENRVYTLSKGTKSVLEKIDEPITLRLYLSQTLATRIPSIGSYAERVKELLEEYERTADGKLNVHLIDPEPFSEEEDRAVGYGLRGVPLDNGDETLYFGLVGTNSTDDEEVIAFLSSSREQFLEYDISKLIYNLANPEQPTIGLIDSLRIRGGASPQLAMRGVQVPPWTVATQLGQLFKIKEIDDGESVIPEEVAALMITHPKSLSDKTLYAIDQYVMRGGKLLVFTDPQADNEQVTSVGMAPMAPGMRSSDLNRLLSVWGVKMVTDRVVGDLSVAATVQMNKEGRTVSFRYPVWLNLLPGTLDQTDPVTAQLGNVSFGTPGHLVPVPEAGTTFTPLISTTSEATQFALEAVGLGADPQDLIRGYEPGGEVLVLAARVTGKVKSAFPDGPPEAAAKASEDGEAKAQEEQRATVAPHLAQSKAPVSFIAVADSDMLHDRFWVQVQEFMGTRIAIPNAANGDFVINAIDNLTGSDDLISVRNRGTFIRPFERIQTMQRQAEVTYREKEEELVQRLTDTENKLRALQEGRDAVGGEFQLSEAQKEELIEFRRERLRIRKELRQVRLDLRRNIESLQRWLKFANIGLVPILIGVFGLIVGLVKLNRRRAPRPASA